MACFIIKIQHRSGRGNPWFPALRAPGCVAKFIYSFSDVIDVALCAHELKAVQRYAAFLCYHIASASPSIAEIAITGGNDAANARPVVFII